MLALRTAGVPLQRVDGACRVQLGLTGGEATRIVDLYQRAPCRVLFPQTEPDQPFEAVLLTTSGGLTAGDRTHVSVELGPRACATIATQAAERVYRAREARGAVNVRADLRVGPGAWGEWLAQETILYDGARLRRSLTADIAASGKVLAVGSMVFGRTAMPESFDVGLLHDALSIRREGRLVWTDALHLEGNVRHMRTDCFGFGTNTAYATVIYVGDDAAEHLDAVRNTLNTSAGLSAASSWDGVLVARVLAGDADELRSVVARLVTRLRQSAGRWSARLPRVWLC